jgi:DNA polymerase-3 subunit delta
MSGPSSGTGGATAKGPADKTGSWLVTGEDASLLGDAVSKLVGELVGDRERSFVVEDFAGEELDVAAVVDACQTPPLFSDRRVVVLALPMKPREVAGLTTDKAGALTIDQLQPLLSYVEEPMPTTKLVVAGRRATLPAKFVNAFKLPGAEERSTDVGSREAHSWVTERLSHGPVKLEPAAATQVEAHLGEDLNRLGMLLVTLEAAYGTGARVGPEELAPYLGQPGSVPPWDLTDAIDRGEPVAEALKLLHRLMEAGSRHPLVVLAILHRHFGNILRVQSPDIATEAQAAEALGIAKGRSTFPARKALDAARRLGMRGSGDAVIALADAELALKGKLDWEPEVVLEVLVARLCRLSRNARGAPVHAGTRGHGRH